MSGTVFGVVVAPSPPPRRPTMKDSFDLDTVLTARAQMLLASGTHKEFKNALRTQQTAAVGAAAATAGSLEPVKPSSSGQSSSKRTARNSERYYPLEWDPRAIPLLCFAESEARRALIKREYEHRVALSAAIHSTMIQVFYSCRLDEMEHDEEARQRRIIGAMERRGRTVLWEAQEELIITQQLQELDIPKEEIVHYLHSHDQGESGAADGATLFSGSVSAVSEARRNRAAASPNATVAKHQIASPRSDQSATQKHQSNSTQEEWVLGIAYLITFDLSMEERKLRLAALREEFVARDLLLRQRDLSKEAVLVAYRSRRHGERCEHYRLQRYASTSEEMFVEHLSAPLFEEWMLITNTLMATACRMEHRQKLYELDAQWAYDVATDALHQLEAQELWHRQNELHSMEMAEHAFLWREHYVGMMFAIEWEEQRLYNTEFVPWIASSRAASRLADRRLRASLSIQVWYRSLRHGLAGWRATHKRLGADIAGMRRRRHRDTERASTSALLNKLSALEEIQ